MFFFIKKITPQYWTTEGLFFYKIRIIKELENNKVSFLKL